ncbi:FtsH protease activity modulator HflK, partial [Rhodovibrio sodomensis]|uniref:FtsH protease activity modulator HflK n=1 Tax=Rhodovibrio sodomensis TaxID=1088 RepID=UPI0019088E1B
ALKGVQSVTAVLTAHSQAPGGQRPPDFDDLVRKAQDRLKKILPGGSGTGGGLGGRGIALIAAVLIGIWFLSGFYRVQTDQQGVVLRFGEWVNTTQPGLNWHLPYPIETVLTPSVERINQINVGFREVGGPAGSNQRDVKSESLMLTGDQNIIDINFTVQWKISDAGRYLFNIRDPEGTVKIAAESAMREVIGRTDIQPALTEARAEIENRTKELLQEILTNYESGILITGLKLQNVQPPEPVIDAFNDVQRALQDRDRLRNEAQAYRNDLIPKARGQAQKMILEAEAYRERIINEAQGEAQRFEQVLAAYKQNPAVTKKRMYLETMQNVYARTDKVLMDAGSTGGTVPYLPLDQLRNRMTGGNPSDQTGTWRRGSPTGGGGSSNATTN